MFSKTEELYGRTQRSSPAKHRGLKTIIVAVLMLATYLVIYQTSQPWLGNEISSFENFKNFFGVEHSSDIVRRADETTDKIADKTTEDKKTADKTTEMDTEKATTTEKDIKQTGKPNVQKREDTTTSHHFTYSLKSTSTPKPTKSGGTNNSDSTDKTDNSNDDDNSDGSNSASATAKSKPVPIYDQPGIRFAFVLGGFIVFNMIAICVHHVYMLLTNSTKSYRNVSQNISPF